MGYNQMNTNCSQLASYIINLRREFHKYPELSLKEYRTSKRIREELESLHIPFYSLGDTDVIAEIKGESGKTVILRADMDALPITEQTDAGYASTQSGVMHACGHDAHTAMLLGSAKLLSENKEMLKGTIRLIFQPAEETGGATKTLIQKGLLHGASTAFAIHVAPDIPTGFIGITDGACMAGVDDFSIKIKGAGGHGAAPHLGTDALMAGAHLAVNLQQIVSREMNPLEPVVVAIGTFHAGTKVNILAKESELAGNIRFFNKELRAYFPQALSRYADCTAKMFRCNAETAYLPSLLPVMNDSKCCALVRSAAEEIWGFKNYLSKEPCTTSEDFSRYLELLPGAMAFLGTGGTSEKTSYPLHHECFDIDEKALLNGSRLYASYAVHWLNENQYTSPQTLQ